MTPARWRGSQASRMRCATSRTNIRHSGLSLSRRCFGASAGNRFCGNTEDQPWPLHRAFHILPALFLFWLHQKSQGPETKTNVTRASEFGGSPVGAGAGAPRTAVICVPLPVPERARSRGSASERHRLAAFSATAAMVRRPRSFPEACSRRATRPGAPDKLGRTLFRSPARAGASAKGIRPHSSRSAGCATCRSLPLSTSSTPKARSVRLLDEIGQCLALDVTRASWPKAWAPTSQRRLIIAR
jgi:hypothetical protein